VVSYHNSNDLCGGGARWSIGSGANIPILDAPWLANGESIDGNIAEGFYVRDFKVQSLLSEHGKSWNVPLIQQIFSTDTAAAILNTPLYDQVIYDRLIWKSERNGCYSVRSAYRLCVEELIDVSHLRRPGNWQNIWSLKVPPKVKNLSWRMCRGCLPTRVRLQDKGVSCPTNCESCGAAHEDLEHLLFECPFAIQVWNSAGIWYDVQHAAMQSDSAVNTIFYLLQQLPMNIKQRVAAIFWSLWKHRNLKIWEHVDENSAQVVDRARNMIEDWYGANLPRTGSVQQAGAQLQQPVTPLQTYRHNNSRPAGTSQLSWTPPSNGRLKCNVDAAFSEHFKRTGIGVCVRDDSGAFVLAKVLQFDHVFPVAVGEALGLYHALQWMQDMQFDNIDFELDSKIARDAFHSHTVDVTEFGHIIDACRDTFSTSFTNSRVEFIRRQANAAAHALAREATSLASPIIYYDIPHCIETIIINEML
jgi:ribonuclease HI